MALNKPTEQLESLSLALPSSLAVDGITEPGSGDRKCAHPFSGEAGTVPVWWYVDLEQSYRMTQVVLYNRASEPAAGKFLNSYVYYRTNDRQRNDNYYFLFF